MVGPNEIDRWQTQYDKGINYWKNQMPGLALLYQLHLANYKLTPELIGNIDDIKFLLGLGFLAAESPHDTLGAHLSSGHRFGLMADAVTRLEGPGDEFARMFQIISDSLLSLQPDEPLESKFSNMKQAYTIVGQRGSGKGTVLEYLEEVGVCTAPSSRGLRAIARVLLKREATTPELVELGQKFKEVLGYDVFIKMVLWQMTSLPPVLWETLAIDGLRTDQELDFFKQLFGERASIIGIIRPATQSDDDAWRVIVERQQKTGKIEYESFQDFVRTQQIERARIDRLISKADIIIKNDGTLDELREKVQAILK